MIADSDIWRICAENGRFKVQERRSWEIENIEVRGWQTCM